MKTKKLEILKNSLDRKESVLNQKFDSHFVDVKHGNGQPMNDKRNGQATMSRWEKQSDSIRNQLKEIEKTKRAIEIEETKIFGCENILENLPQAFLDCLESGELTQWRKFPNRFFVKNGGRGRIIWENKKLFCSYVPEVGTPEREFFAACFNKLKNQLN
tara:strand:- start:48340 stop:48816 length:477 start_codon:yes stop_codon:yes gene_type:complete